MSAFLFVIRQPPLPTLFPYTTLFRSASPRRPGRGATPPRCPRGSDRVTPPAAAAAPPRTPVPPAGRSEEHTSELQSQSNLVCRLLLEKKKTQTFRSPSREVKALLGCH